MARLVPVLIAVLAVAALTVVEGTMTERWADNRHCAYCATLLDDVPNAIGEWEGEDSDVETYMQEAAGARGFVSRTYRNDATGQRVGVWFIVGHPRDTARHTPNICYAGQGFDTDEEPTSESLKLADGSEATFKTMLFEKSMPQGTHRERVFWTWFKPDLDSGEPVTWQAPDNQRTAFGATQALYKLYFTTYGEDATEVDESVCLEFAQDFFAAVEPILQKANEEIPADYVVTNDAV